MRARGTLREVSAALCVVCAGATLPAHAQGPGEAPPLAVVVEADHLDGIQLRAALRQRLGRALTTLSRAQAATYGPRSVLTVAVDPDAGISVMLWEQGSESQMLWAPIGQNASETIERAATLAHALLARQSRQQTASRLETNPYLRPLPKAPRPRPRISPINPYYRTRL